MLGFGGGAQNQLLSTSGIITKDTHRSQHLPLASYRGENLVYHPNANGVFLGRTHDRLTDTIFTPQLSPTKARNNEAFAATISDGITASFPPKKPRGGQIRIQSSMSNATNTTNPVSKDPFINASTHGKTPRTTTTRNLSSLAPFCGQIRERELYISIFWFETTGEALSAPGVLTPYLPRGGGFERCWELATNKVYT